MERYSGWTSKQLLRRKGILHNEVIPLVADWDELTDRQRARVVNLILVRVEQQAGEDIYLKRFLGSGSEGSVWELVDGRVLKLVPLIDDKREDHKAKIIQKHQQEDPQSPFVKIYAAGEIKDQVELKYGHEIRTIGLDLSYVIMEKGEPLEQILEEQGIDPYLLEKVQDFLRIYRKGHYHDPRWDQSRQWVNWDFKYLGIPEEHIDTIICVADKLAELQNLMNELGFTYADAHFGNIVDKEGLLKYIDFSTCGEQTWRSRKSKRPPKSSSLKSRSHTIKLLVEGISRGASGTGS